MKFFQDIKRALQSQPVFAVTLVVAVPLILLRLFGVLFFASTTPMWAVIPALTLGSLLVVSSQLAFGRRIMATILGAIYLCSVFFYGWADMKTRLDEGQGNWFDVLEASVILVLMVRCLTTQPAARRTAA